VNDLRRLRRTFASLTAAAFVAVWASMAIVPCVMAAEAAMDADCPHCPPPPCHDQGSDSPDCGWVEGYYLDGRQAALSKLDLKPVALPAPAEFALPVPAATTFRPVSPRAPPDPAGPRLHLRNCVLND